MKKYLLPLSLVAVSPALYSANMDVSIGAFQNPTDFSLSTETIPFRFTELSGVESANNTATHIIIEGLYPVGSGNVHSSNYQAIDLNNSGTVQDVGVVYLDMPTGASLPEGTVASPIVGVVQRTGSWDSYTLSVPSTTVGGSTGVSSYDESAGTMSIDVSRGEEHFTGSVNYTVVDENTVELGEFTMMTDGSASYEFDGSVLIRDGVRYYGTIASLDDLADFDSLLFSIELSNLPDVDFDGVPDLTDSEISNPGPLVVGGWADVPGLGWTYGYSAINGYSLALGQVYVAKLPYVYLYNYNWGWMYYVTTVEGTRNSYFFNNDLEYVFINVDFGGWFQSSANGWAFDNFITPQPKS